MEDLFSDSNNSLTDRPLADRMRARNLDEYVGQDHLVGKGRLLRRCIAADRLSSAIFYGPPGVGKTTLARVIARHTKSAFITLNAVLTGVSDIRAAIKDAEEYYKLYSRRTILFVDEVHRWSKSQQDALLPFVENGTIILIGATTENPFFEVNRALVSRSRIFQLVPLTNDDLRKIADMAIHDTDRGYGHWNVEFEDGALEHLIDSSAGDARNLLNALELAVVTTPNKWDPDSNPPSPAYMSTIYITREAAEQSIQKKVVLYDKDGDYHYDIISAFIKSLRGRDVDAALYYLARMIAAGEDPHFIFRRMLISSCEDTGLADPTAISIVQSCSDAFDRVGLPEGRYFLAHAAMYLSTAPKSNSSMAFFDALKLVEETGGDLTGGADISNAEIPNHLKDGSRDAKGLGHGAGYKYPHAYQDHWVAQQYLPKELVGKVFYTPTTQGYEAKIHDEVISRREVQTAAIMQSIQQSAQDTRQETLQWWGSFENAGRPNLTQRDTVIQGVENLTFSPPDKKKESALTKADKMWQSRVDENRAEVLLAQRDAIIKKARLLRHYRTLIWGADDGLILWQVCRTTPEGAVCAVCKSSRAIEILNQSATALDVMDRPMFLVRKGKYSGYLTAQEFNEVLIEAQYKGLVFDRAIFSNPFNNIESITALCDALKYVAEGNKHIGLAFGDDKNITEKIKATLPDDFSVVIWQRIPCHTQHIALLIEQQILTKNNIPDFIEILEKLDAAETKFFGDKTNPLFAWDEDAIQNIFTSAGFLVDSDIIETVEKRRITKNDIAAWFSNNSRYGCAMYNECGRDLQKLVDLLENACDKKIFAWHTTNILLSIAMKKD